MILLYAALGVSLVTMALSTFNLIVYRIMLKNLKTRGKYLAVSISSVTFIASLYYFIETVELILGQPIIPEHISTVLMFIEMVVLLIISVIQFGIVMYLPSSLRRRK